MPHRCPWVPVTDDIYVEYHDLEWGVPVYSDATLFEHLSLEVAQIGLSWRTVLGKREAYRELFQHFEIEKVAQFTIEHIQEISHDPRIIRYQKKNTAIVSNAKRSLILINEFGSLSNYFWKWVDFKTIVNSPKELKDYLAYSKLSEDIAHDLKKRGFAFIGRTNVYAFLQSVGIINDHTVDCFRYKELRNI